MEENKKAEVLEEKKEEVKPEVKQEVNIEPQKKKNSVLSIILVIILMAACLVVGYFINDAGIFNFSEEKEVKQEEKEKKEEKKEPVVTNYAVTDEKVANLIRNIHAIGSGVNNCDITEFYTNDKKVVASDVPNLMAYHIAEKNEFLEKSSFTLDDMNKAIKKYLGKDYQFDPTKIDYKGVTCPQFNYDSNNKVFNKQETACGWTCGPHADYKIVKAVDTDGLLKIDVKVIFYSYEKNDSYYSDYAKTKVIGSQMQNYNNASYDGLFDKGSDYQFTFKLEDGNYVFVSSEPVKK